eukprot:9421299-Alexandrium_andersonii.AAC.1
MRWEVSPFIVATDACESGYGVVRRRVLPGDIMPEVLHEERWRFKLQHVRATGARARANADASKRELAEDPASEDLDYLSDVATVRSTLRGEVRPEVQ